MRKIRENMENLIEYTRSHTPFNEDGWNEYAAVFSFRQKRTIMHGYVDYIYKKGDRFLYVETIGRCINSFYVNHLECSGRSAETVVDWLSKSLTKIISEYTDGGSINFTFLNLLRFCPATYGIWADGPDGCDSAKVWCDIVSKGGQTSLTNVLFKKHHLENRNPSTFIRIRRNRLMGDLCDVKMSIPPDDPNYRRWSSKTNHKAKKLKKSIYLMKCKNTGHYKIGISKNPKARESTLQSEKPSIKMVGQWDQLAGMERELHQQYADQRIRGEWFNLTPAQVRFICHDLTTKSKQVANF